VLEIGSFTGSFLKAAAHIQWGALGLDIGIETSSFARARGLNVMSVDLLEAQLPEFAWDAAFIWNTFDQLANPWRVLSQ
jgi:hypothetical protein